MRIDIKNIEDLEKEISCFIEVKKYHRFIKDDSFYKRFRIENHNDDYNSLFQSNTHLDLEKFNIKINNFKEKENNFIKIANELNKKFEIKKINKKVNKILKIITFGIFNWNKKIEKKIIILEKIKEIFQHNLVKINERKYRIKNKMEINSMNLQTPTSEYKPNLLLM